MTRARRIDIGIGCRVEYLLDLKLRRHRQDLHDAGRVAKAGKLHQNFVLGVRPPVLLNRWFRQPQTVDAIFDSRDRLRHRVVLE